MLIKTKYLTFDLKQLIYYDMLDTREKAKTFAVNLALMNYPKSKEYIEKKCLISEDKTKQLWLVILMLADSGANDRELVIIIRKNDCKIVQMSCHI